MSASDGAVRPKVRLALGPLVCGLVLGAAGYWPTREVGGDEAVTAMIAAVVVVTAVVYATLIPALRRMVRADDKHRLLLGFHVAAVRFIVTLSAAAMIAWRELVEPQAFLIWIAVAYVLMTLVETWVLVCWNRQLVNRSS